MSNQHRATPDQWAAVQETSSASLSSCILELRARVEVLEAAANDRQQDEDAERAAAPSRADGLVERVANAITADPLLSSPTPVRQARAAIREVAAWLRELNPRPGSIEATTLSFVADGLEHASNQ